MFNLDQTISEWRRQMLSAGIQTPVPLEELEIHLREDVEQGMRSGLTAQAAFETAAQRMGQADGLKGEFKKVEEDGEVRDRKLLQFLVVVLTSLIALSTGYMALFKISLAARIMLGLALGFELPVVLLALVKSGILNYEKLVKMRCYVVVWNLILGALLTTPEVLTQVIMAAALQMFYEAGVRIAWHWERRENRA